MKTDFIALLLIAIVMCSCATPAQRNTQDRLNSVIIPEVDFRNANARDVLIFLWESANNAETQSRTERSIGMIYSEVTPPTSPANGEGFAAPPELDTSDVFMYATNISLCSALDSFCQHFGLRYWIDRQGIIHFTRKSEAQPAH